ncbi:MAG: glycosyltransferase family 2 protein [Luteolibacter sp.]
MPDRRTELLIVMPVYNEHAAVTKVLTEWFIELKKCSQDFIFLVIDDGSTDETLTDLHSLRAELGERLEVLTRENRGHGQTCMQGYRIASERAIPFVFQIDSDGQCDPRFFHQFWEQRGDFDVIYGRRSREDGIRRILASYVLRWNLRILGRVDCVDPNVPYRLMRTKACAPAYEAIPADFFLANVALAVVLRRTPGLRHGEIPIRFLKRFGGEPSVPLSKFAIKAIELVRQLKTLGP